MASYRYGPSWGFFRYPYRPSEELLARLTPQRRQTIQPHGEVVDAARTAAVLTERRRRAPMAAGQPGPAALLPPSIAIVAPVIIAAASEHRKRISAATSPGSIRRPQAAASGALRR